MRSVCQISILGGLHASDRVFQTLFNRNRSGNGNADMVYGWRCAARRATATTHNQLASTVVGDASAARVSVLGILGTATTTAIADTGTLSGVNDARDASMVTGSVPSTLSAE